MEPMTLALQIPVPPCAADGAPNPLKATGAPLRWGIVSTGGIAGRVAGGIARLEDAVLHAVSSRNRNTAADFANRYGCASSYCDDGDLPGYRAMMHDPAVDVVYVATPHGQHFEVARAALEAGKHVLCEKAFTVNAHEAEKLIALARANGLFLMEAVWTRFLPAVNRAWEIIASGEIGEPQWVQADLGFPAPYNPASRIWAPVAGGGALLDLTVYPLQWALGALGFPASVSAAGTLNDDGVDAQNALTLSYASGAHAQLTSSFLGVCPGTATVSGSEGWLRAGAPLHNPRELTVRNGDGEVRVERFEESADLGYAYELREVTRCIQQGLTESPTMPLQHTLDTMRLFDGVRAQLGVAYPNDARSGR
jgi:predicted dehydrogenase